MMLITSLLLFIVLFPVSNNINFMQNDDWVYYKQVNSFLQGDYRLDPYIEATFYTQGLLGALFAKMYGIVKLPVLTLIVSVLNYFLFTYMCRRFLLKSTFDSILLGLLVFVSPLHMYSLLGFMTDNFFIFYSLVSLILAQMFLENKNYKHLALFNIAVITGFLGRQLVVIFPIALILQLLVTKKWRHAIMQTLITTLLLVFYFLIFPTTGEMKANHSFNLEKIQNLRVLFSSVYVYLFYGVVFTIPLVSALLTRINPFSKIVLTSILSLAILVAIQLIYLPSQNLNPDMYYLGNTVTRDGFFSGSHLRAGNKYTIHNEKQIYLVWEYLTKIALSLGIAVVITRYKSFLNLYSLSLIAYMGSMTLLKVVYDRYLTILGLLVILIILAGTKNTKLPGFTRVVTMLFTVLLLIYSYNFSIEFFLINNQMWKKANSLVNVQGVKKEKISAGYAWNRMNVNLKRDHRYIFSYEDKEQNPNLSSYRIIDTIKLNYPLNLFNNPTVYLYKRDF